MKIDPIVKKELNRLQFDPEQCLWDCHGTWVMYHRYVEIAGAKSGITYQLHDVEFNTANKIAVIKCVAEDSKGNSVTTYGEASPSNCRNAYTVAMAEKRAIDRAVLKLLGIHGFIYSEDEVDNKVELSDSDLERMEKQLTEIANKPKGKQKATEFWNNLEPKAKKALKTRGNINDLFTS